MKVLGINAIFHDPAAALVVDGVTVAAAEEERFSRRKHGKRPVPFSAWELPEQAARWYAGFSDALASLRENPERCPLAPENGRFPYEIHELHYGLGSRPTHRAACRQSPAIARPGH